MHCSKVQGKMQSELFGAALQHRLTAGTDCSDTYGGLLTLYKCAVTQYQCTAALLRAKCNPHCSVLLCRTGSQQALFDCSDTYGGLPSTNALQLMAECSSHCSVPLRKTGSQQALYDCSHTYGGLLSPYRCAVTQYQCTAALLRAKCNPHCSVLLCRTSHSRHNLTAVTPTEVCSLCTGVP